MKSTLELRPVFHHLEDRIRAHILLCWLALLLIRIAETETGDTWRNLRNTLDQIHLVELAGTTGQGLQLSELTAPTPASSLPSACPYHPGSLALHPPDPAPTGHQDA
ncbi:MAG: hypothetical protein Q8K58_01260 [Acidimicrobiales bacterium]|nr:hypothetical protein [Acidimicrobiales bacterium]